LWAIPRDTGAEYQQQVTSEQQVGGKWRLRRGQRDNHLWDCEVLQLLGATIFGYHNRLWADGGADVQEETTNEQVPNVPEKAGM
jgi:hypothetical protein